MKKQQVHMCKRPRKGEVEPDDEIDQDLKARLLKLRERDKYCYYTGYLLYAIRTGEQQTRQQLRSLRATVFRLAKQGYGYLTQERLGDDQYNYIFTRSARNAP